MSILSITSDSVLQTTAWKNNIMLISSEGVVYICVMSSTGSLWVSALSSGCFSLNWNGLLLKFKMKIRLSTWVLTVVCGGLAVAWWTAKWEVQGSNPGQGRNLDWDFYSICTANPPLGPQISGYQSQSQAWNLPRERNEWMGADTSVIKTRKKSNDNVWATYEDIVRFVLYRCFRTRLSRWKPNCFSACPLLTLNCVRHLMRRTKRLKG